MTMDSQVSTTTKYNTSECDPSYPGIVITIPQPSAVIHLSTTKYRDTDCCADWLNEADYNAATSQ